MQLKKPLPTLASSASFSSAVPTDRTESCAGEIVYCNLFFIAIKQAQKFGFAMIDSSIYYSHRHAVMDVILG